MLRVVVIPKKAMSTQQVTGGSNIWFFRISMQTSGFIIPSIKWSLPSPLYVIHPKTTTFNYFMTDFGPQTLCPDNFLYGPPNYASVITPKNLEFIWKSVRSRTLESCLCYPIQNWGISLCFLLKSRASAGHSSVPWVFIQSTASCLRTNICYCG